MEVNTMTIFVTVGTTKFDKLIETVLEDEVLMELSRRGYRRLILQIGNTNLTPDCTPRCGFEYIETFTLKPSINEYMRFADLIISHAGAGSCLEALGAKKPLIVVTNDLLMDNHQSELAEQLSQDKYLYQCTCTTLLEVCKSMNLLRLKRFVDDKSPKIAEIIDYIMGFE
ncbi:GSCOCG00005854001-RA-CDS [Cotesia congregata]|nr:GSCOCG00005854001-RA-CDS [Cotesia congregata]